MKGFDFDELHIIADEIYESHVTPKMSQRKKEKAVNDIFDELLDLMIYYYLLGSEDCIKDLGYSVVLPEDAQHMYDTVMARIDGKNLKDRVREHVEQYSPGKFRTLVDSEAHRNYCASGDNTADLVAQALGKTGTKMWMTMLDEKVRDTHAHLQSKRVPIGEEFFTFDGDHAPCPGGFETAENNANCRCFLIYTLD